jgi:hypothetical protein
MVLARWQATITDEEGNVLPGATVTVQREATGNPLAVLYSDRAGTTPLGNPFAADGDGFAAFHTAGGPVRITATSGAFSRTWRYVGIGLAGERDYSDAGLPFLFDNGVNDADPGTGNFRFNNSTPGLATFVYISDTDADGNDVSAWIETFDVVGLAPDHGTLIFQSSNVASQVIATVSAPIVDAVGYKKIPIVIVSATAAATFEQATRYGVDFGANGADGADGLMPGYPFNFDSATAMADPGAGDFRLNNATLSAVTAAAFDDTSAATGNPDVSAAVLSWDDSTNTVRGYLVIKDVLAPENYAIYSITGASTDNAGWTQLALTYVTHAGALTNGNRCSVEFSRAGDVGAQGTVVGKQSIWIPAGAMTPRVTSGAATGSIDSGSNDVTIQVLDFDQTTAEHAQFQIGMPKSWNESTVTFTPYWTAAAGTAAQTMIFALAGVAISNDDPLNAAMGTSQTSSDALIAIGDLHIGPESAAITIGGTPAEGDLVIFNLARDISDTLAADARLIGIMLHITLNANTDA